ncbi:MAG: hypothetical protein NWR21_08265, partial [Verrucomicrobiales bacterium]|nr:hypothetical protein [Verrucomicrobiales bacterium]
MAHSQEGIVDDPTLLTRHSPATTPLKPSFHTVTRLGALVTLLMICPGSGAANPMLKDKLSAIDTEIEASIAKGEIPGA